MQEASQQEELKKKSRTSGIDKVHTRDIITHMGEMEKAIQRIKYVFKSLKVSLTQLSVRAYIRRMLEILDQKQLSL